VYFCPWIRRPFLARQEQRRNNDVEAAAVQPAHLIFLYLLKFAFIFFLWITIGSKFYTIKFKNQIRSGSNHIYIHFELKFT
jgi:hypothetical protein